MGEGVKAREKARGGENLTPPTKDLDQAPRELVRELLEAGVPFEVIRAALDTHPVGADRRLTAPLAIRSRRARF